MLDIAILGDPRDDTPDLSINNEACEGIYKLVQKVMVLFLTDLNDPKQIGYGTDIPELSFSSNIQDTALLQNIVDQALSEVYEDVKEGETDDTPEDEALDSLDAAVSEARPSRDTQLVTITVTSVAGEDAVVSMPIEDIFNRS